MISELFGILSKISAICTDSNDSWNSLTFKGVLSDNNHKEIFRELSSIT